MGGPRADGEQVEVRGGLGVTAPETPRESSSISPASRSTARSRGERAAADAARAVNVGGRCESRSDRRSSKLVMYESYPLKPKPGVVLNARQVEFSAGLPAITTAGLEAGQPNGVGSPRRAPDDPTTRLAQARELNGLLQRHQHLPGALGETEV